jgi:hypothetical protein
MIFETEVADRAFSVAGLVRHPFVPAPVRRQRLLLRRAVDDGPLWPPEGQFIQLLAGGAVQ